MILLFSYSKSWMCSINCRFKRAQVLGQDPGHCLGKPVFSWDRIQHHPAVAFFVTLASINSDTLWFSNIEWVSYTLEQSVLGLRGEIPCS